jgi:membrane protease YdiL (CAAX protease family)
MQYKSVKGHTGSSQLGTLLMLAGVGLIVSVLFQLLFAIALLPSGTKLSELESALMIAMQDPNNVGALRIMQMVSTMLIMFVPALWYNYICHGKKWQWLGFNKHLNPIQVILGFLLIFSANILAGPLQELSEHLTTFIPRLHQMAKSMEDTYNENVKILSNLQNPSDLISAIFIMAFLPALFEEMFFRGALQNILTRWWQKPYLAILVTSVLFSLIHFSIWLFISRFIMGVALGIMFYTTRNIWVNTIAHFLNNMIAVIQMYMLSKEKKAIDVNKLDPHIDWWMAIIAAGALVYLIVLLQRYSKEKSTVIETEEQTLFIAEQKKYHPFPNTAL